MPEYCFVIEFKEPILTNRNDEEINAFHTHLITDDKTIELRICFDPNDFYFEHIFSEWLKRINWSNIGEHFQATKIKESDIHNLDFSQSNVIGFKSGSNQYINAEKYVAIELDWIKFLRKPNEEKTGSAEFYLNDNGFSLVKEYYSVLWQDKEETFSYKRMQDVSDSHRIGDITFNPEFNFYSHDSRDESQSTIHKEPKFQLSFSGDKTDEEILKAFKWLSLSSSFYYKRVIDFTTARIHLHNNTIVIRKKCSDLTDKSDKMGLWPVYKVRNIDAFYKKLPTYLAIEDEHLKRLELIVRKFYQANLVDIRSSILLRFAILEICNSANKKTSKPQRFNFIENGEILSKKGRTKLLTQARDLILDKVNETEKDEFTSKWSSSIEKIIVKPMRSPFVQYLESIGFKPDDFTVDFATIKSVRDAITHGSTEGYSEHELLRCNQMLYRINIGLILHQLRVKDWIDDLDINHQN